MTGDKAEPAIDQPPMRASDSGLMLEAVAAAAKRMTAGRDPSCLMPLARSQLLTVMLGATELAERLIAAGEVLTHDFQHRSPGHTIGTMRRRASALTAESPAPMVM